MLPLVVWTFAALALAAVVLVVASVAGGRTGDVRVFGQDLVAGLHGLRRRPGGRPAEAPEPVDSSFDELLAAAEVNDPAYLAVEDLTDTLARARERAARGVSGLTRR